MLNSFSLMKYIRGVCRKHRAYVRTYNKVNTYCSERGVDVELDLIGSICNDGRRANDTMKKT